MYRKLFKSRCQIENDFLSFKNKSKSATWICIRFPSKLRQKIIETTSIFLFIEIRSKKNTSKWHRIFAHRNYGEKCTSRRYQFLSNRNYVTTLIFCPSNDVEKNTSKQCQFLSIEITLKKYAKKKRKFVDIFSSTYQRNIAIKSTLIRRGVSAAELPLTGCETT